MPVDEHGNRADVIFDGNATINRTNPGRMYEHYYNAARRDVHKKISASLNIKPFERESVALRQLNSLPEQLVNEQMQRLLSFYDIIAPTMSQWWREGSIQATPQQYLAEVINRGNGLHVPTDHQNSAPEVVMQLENHPDFRPLYGPVTFQDYDGNLIKTKDNVRVAPMYLILLEKTGDDWSAVSSSKLHLFGVLSQITKNDKFSQPVRAQPVRVLGEGELRLMQANCGERFTAEVADINNNPIAHQAMVSGLLSADEPGNVERLVDRSVIPYGGHKALQFFRHLCQVSGFEMEYEAHDSNKPKIY